MGKRLTVEDYAALGEDPPGKRLELDNGVLIVTPSPNYFHNRTRDALAAALLNYLSGKALGTVVSEQDFNLFGKTVRRPDVAFITTAKLRKHQLLLRKTPLPFAPDLVIEVLSDSDKDSALKRKIADYLRAGVITWTVYPQDDRRYAERHCLLNVEKKTVIEEGFWPDLGPPGGILMPVVKRGTDSANAPFSR